MPALTPSGSKVLVTGANGYISVWVVQKLLEKGFSVRGAVRSAGKGQYLKDYFKGYGDKLEIVVVPDITAEGAFDEAVKDVDAIAHMASPFTLKVDDPQELIKPAVDGTVGILKSALKNGSNVKRIVITSSFVSVFDFTASPITEHHWNDAAIREVEEKGRGASDFGKYSASKTLAEKAAWDFYAQHKPDVEWDLVVLNPPYVYGPFIHEVSSLKGLNESMQSWWDTVVDEGPKTIEALTAPNVWVDVRDIAEAHVLALEKEEAGGERIIVMEGAVTGQEWLNAIHDISPAPRINHSIAKGFQEVEITSPFKVDASKSARIFGQKLRTKEETARDILRDIERRGW